MITVNAGELKDLMETRPGLALLNVRPAGTFSEGQVPGSMHVPQAELESRAKALLLNKDALIAVYGSDITCEASTRAAQILEKLGYKNIYNFSAGLKGWKDAGFTFLNH